MCACHALLKADSCIHLRPLSQTQRSRTARNAVNGPDENRGAIVSQAGWEEWLLELLLDGAACTAAGRTASPSQPLHTHPPWRWQGPELDLIRSMLKSLLSFCVCRVPHGWQALDQTACHVRCGCSLYQAGT